MSHAFHISCNFTWYHFDDWIPKVFITHIWTSKHRSVWHQLVSPSFLRHRHRSSVVPITAMAPQNSNIPSTAKVWGLRFNLMKPGLSWAIARAYSGWIGKKAISHIDNKIKGTVCRNAVTKAYDMAKESRATGLDDDRNAFQPGLWRDRFILNKVGQTTWF